MERYVIRDKAKDSTDSFIIIDTTINKQVGGTYSKDNAEKKVKELNKEAKNNK